MGESNPALRSEAKTSPHCWVENEQRVHENSVSRGSSTRIAIPLLSLMLPRQRYTKPVIMQLHYETEPSAAIATPCKTAMAGGPTISGCTLTNTFTPCNALGS